MGSQIIVRVPILVRAALVTGTHKSDTGSEMK